MVQETTYLSHPTCRSRLVSEPWLTKATPGPKCRGKSFGTTLWYHVQRYCCLGILHAHPRIEWNLTSPHIQKSDQFQLLLATIKKFCKGSPLCILPKNCQFWVPLKRMRFPNSCFSINGNQTIYTATDSLRSYAIEQKCKQCRYQRFAYSLCMMADFENALISRIFGVFSSGFLHRQLEMICRMDFDMFFGILIFDPN